MPLCKFREIPLRKKFGMRFHFVRFSVLHNPRKTCNWFITKKYSFRVPCHLSSLRLLFTVGRCLLQSYDAFTDNCNWNCVMSVGLLYVYSQTYELRPPTGLAKSGHYSQVVSIKVARFGSNAERTTWDWNGVSFNFQVVARTGLTALEFFSAELPMRSRPLSRSADEITRAKRSANSPFPLTFFSLFYSSRF